MAIESLLASSGDWRLCRAWPLRQLPAGIVALALVVLGLVYGGLAIDAEDATAYLVLTLAVGATAGADVLSHIQRDWRFPGRHRRSGQYLSLCRGRDRACQEGAQARQGLKSCFQELTAWSQTQTPGMSRPLLNLVG